MKAVTQKSRLLHLDFMRGIFLCVIIIDHLQKFPGIFDLFTGRGLLWASAAEGFFFLSGILLGLVRGQREQRLPFVAVFKKLWQRAGLLYVWNVGLTIFFTFLAQFFKDNVGIKPGFAVPDSWMDVIREAFTLQYIYGWADFLQYYAVFLFAAPLAIWLLRRGYWWLVVALSGTVWFFSGQNYYLSWQLLFFGGAIIGYHMTDIRTWWRRLSSPHQLWLGVSAVVLSIATFIASSVFVLGPDFLRNQPETKLHQIISLEMIASVNTSLGASFDKASLGVGRLAIFCLWFFAAYFSLSRFRGFYENHPVGRTVVRLGQNSLYVYIVHSLLVFSLNLVLPGNYGLFGNALIDIGIIGLIVWLVRHRVGFQVIPR